MNRSGPVNLFLRRTAAPDAEHLHKPSSHYNLCGLTRARRNPQHITTAPCISHKNCLETFRHAARVRATHRTVCSIMPRMFHPISQDIIKLMEIRSVYRDNPTHCSKISARDF